MTISVAPPKAEAAEAPGGNGGSHTAAGVPKVLQSECFSRRYAPRTLPLSRQVPPPPPTPPPPPFLFPRFHLRMWIAEA